MASRVPDGPPDHAHRHDAVLSDAQLSAINRFPDDNPNPVMRIDLDGYLMYSNPASAGVLRAIGAGVGERVPAEILARCLDAAAVRPGPSPAGSGLTASRACHPVPQCTGGQSQSG